MRGLQAGGAAVSVQHRDFKIFVKDQFAARSDMRKEVESLTVASHQHMLAVVDEVSGVGIRKRVRAATERGFALEYRDAEALLRQHHGGAQAREAGADYHD